MSGDERGDGCQLCPACQNLDDRQTDRQTAGKDGREGVQEEKWQDEEGKEEKNEGRKGG